MRIKEIVKFCIFWDFESRPEQKLFRTAINILCYYGVLISRYDNFFSYRQDKFVRTECGENIKEQKACRPQAKHNDVYGVNHPSRVARICGLTSMGNNSV